MGVATDGVRVPAPPDPQSKEEVAPTGPTFSVLLTNGIEHGTLKQVLYYEFA